MNSADNPADQASIGLNADNLIESKNWIERPGFLLKPECEWPVLSENMMLCPVDDSELKRVSTVNTICTPNTKECLERLICHYSSWNQLKKAVVRLTRLKEILLDLSHKRK